MPAIEQPPPLGATVHRYCGTCKVRPVWNEMCGCLVCPKCFNHVGRESCHCGWPKTFKVQAKRREPRVFHSR
jgi:hypothetical protein